MLDLSNPLLIALLLMLTASSYTDLKLRKIPNALIVVGLITSLIGQCFFVQGIGGLNWLAGVGLGFVCFVPLYLLRGMSAGDVKLMMAVGGFLGYPTIIDAVLNSLFAGVVLAFMLVVYKGRVKKLIHNMRMMWVNAMIKSSTGVNVADDDVMKNSAGRLPFALAIAIGSLITLYQQST